VSRQIAVDHVTDRAQGYGIPCQRVDGNDVLAVHEATRKAIARARKGEGPTLIECETFRMTGHSAHDGAEYVPKELFEKWKKKDPILRFEKYLQENKLLSRRDIDDLYTKVQSEVEAAVTRAEQSPYPDPAGLLEGVFAATERNS
jgi:pyruvate dehydrogenase E1 component alpha subunit